MTMAVAPAARRARARSAAARRARGAGASATARHTCMLEVRADNDAARSLYDRKRASTLLTVRRRYYQPGDVDALVMRLHVSEGAR